jgi:serine/threonine protein kinase
MASGGLDDLADYIRNADDYEIDEMMRRKFGSLLQFQDKKTGKIVSGLTAPDSTVESEMNCAAQLTVLTKLTRLYAQESLGLIRADPSLDLPAILLMPIVAHPPICLSDALVAERGGAPIEGWNDTKKSIVIFGVAELMYYLHSNGIVHGDLKCEHIVLNSRLEPSLAPWSFQSSGMIGTKIPSKIGTPLYMAPEIAHISPESSVPRITYTPELDVFSYAVLIRRILTDDLTLDDNYGEAATEWNYLDRVAGSHDARLKLDGISCLLKFLITQSWNRNANERPKFSNIVEALIKCRSECAVSNDVDLEQLQEYEHRIMAKFGHELNPGTDDNVPLTLSFRYSDDKATRLENKPITSSMTVSDVLEAYSARGLLFGGYQFAQDKRLSDIPLRRDGSDIILLNRLWSRFGQLNLEFDLSGYTILRTQGSGAYGTVYAMLNSATRDTVAVKRITVWQGVYKYFKREVMNLRELNHPCIVKLRGVVEPLESDEEQRPGIVMEFLGYGNFGRRAKTDLEVHLGAFVPEWWKPRHVKVKVIVGIVHAMKYLHSKNIFHRDLKPWDVLFDEHYHAKLIDFGFSREYGEAIGLSIGKGTLVYMAPEIWVTNYSPKVDVWSFGVLLYETLVADMSFHSEAGRNRFMAVMNSDKRPDLKDALQVTKDLINDCWKENPDHRPSFEEIWSRLVECDFKIITDVDVEEVKKYVREIESAVQSGNSL